MVYNRVTKCEARLWTSQVRISSFVFMSQSEVSKFSADSLGALSRQNVTVAWDGRGETWMSWYDIRLFTNVHKLINSEYEPD